MSERFGSGLRPTCSVCRKPLEIGDHSNCKKTNQERGWNDRDEIEEYHNLLGRAKAGVDTLSSEERERLTEIGYHDLYDNENGYRAMRVFEVLQDFVGLRKTAEWMSEKIPDSYDLSEVLLALEDYNTLRDLLNQRSDKSNNGYDIFGEAFYPLVEPLSEYIKQYLKNNGTPVATGDMDVAKDLTAIRNLAQEYDIAVPIARGGLRQGAIADLWGMKTRIIDIAAHERKTPRGKWVSPVEEKEFAGKRVLLFDKDAVSGATIKKVVKMLAGFKPERTDVYFFYNIVPAENRAIGTVVDGLPPEVTTYCPANAPRHNTGDAFIEAHEKLGTTYGQRRLVERTYVEEFIPSLKKQYPDLAKAAETFLVRHLQVYDSLNPYLAGVEKLREHILSNLNKIHEDCESYLKTKMFEVMPNVKEGLRRIMETANPLSVGFETDLINARYRSQTDEMAKKRGVENPHNPSQPLAAFHAARTAVEKGFDIALIVGPEGFAYEPYFLDLGIQTVAVNIPESGESETRTIKLFGDLAVLQDKKVLVVEDDIRTGATLQKVLETLQPNKPRQLGLYLGQPENYQIKANIPVDFTETYVAGDGVKEEELAEGFKKYLESKGLRIFKNTETIETVETK